MAQLKSTLVANKTWSAKRRYKIGMVVSYLGANYQNLTGANATPGTNGDWKGSLTTAYKGTFIYASGAQEFSLPSGTVLSAVFLNRALLDDLTEWSLSGTTLTVITTLAVSDEIKVIGTN